MGSMNEGRAPTGAITVKLTPDQLEYLQRRLRGQGGFQSLLARLQHNLNGSLLTLTRADCEQVVRYAMEYGEGGFQARLRTVIQEAQRFCG